MLKNHWYALEFAEDVTDVPHKAEIMGQHLVLYRDSHGEVVAQSDICIHRGGPLSGGKVKGDCIECPYHGWQYDTSGACVSIPANREGLPIPKKARVDTYPCVERYGMIFVFLGDLDESERPPIPDLSLEGLSPVPGAEHDGMRSIRGEFHWEANFERVMENAVDIAHARAWIDEVIHPLVAEEPRRAPALAEGALMRLEAGRRCFARYRREFGL